MFHDFDLAAYDHCLSVIVNHYRPMTDIEKPVTLARQKGENTSLKFAEIVPQ